MFITVDFAQNTSATITCKINDYFLNSNISNRYYMYF